MNTRHLTGTMALLVLLLVCPVFASVQVHTVKVGEERLEFMPQPEKGYVVRTTGVRRQESGVRKQHTASVPEKAMPIGGIGRRGLWVVEDEPLPAEISDTRRVGWASAHADISYQAPLFCVNGETVAVIPEIVIRVKAGMGSSQVKALCEKAGCTIITPMEFTTQEYLLEVLGPDAEAVFAAVGQLSQAPEVEWACPNTAFRPRLAGQSVLASAVADETIGIPSEGEDSNTPGVFPNDEYFPLQWHLHNTGQSGGTPGADVRAPEAWEITTGDPNIIVALIDGGVDLSHPDLIDNLVSGYDFWGNDDQPTPSLDHWVNAHGTACAGLMAADGNNTIGVVGVAPNCKIMPIRILNAGPDGIGRAITEADIATAIRYAANGGADILSNSWGFTGVKPLIHSAIEDVVQAGGIGRNGRGCIVLFAAGNSEGRIPSSEIAAYPEVICVAATDHSDRRCWYSVYGFEIDMAAPSGGGVVVPNLAEAGEEYMRLSVDLLWTTDILGVGGFSMFNRNSDLLDYTEKMWGTSGACPIAAGVAALILSIEPNLTGDEVRHFLERSAKDLGDPGRDDYYGWGRVDARAALDMVLAYRCDLNRDWRVDEQDLAILNAVIDANDLSADIAPAKKRDGKVDANDLAILTRYLGTAIPELGLFAHWKLDEAEGLTAYDCIDHRDGDLQGGGVWQPVGGKIGGALEFDGADDYVATEPIWDPPEGPLSVFAWVKDGAPGQVVVSQQKGANWLMADASQGVLMTELKSTARFSGPLRSRTVITDGNWHHVGLVCDGARRILYVDDVEDANDVHLKSLGSGLGLYMGAGKNREAGSSWKGLIDDVRIYNIAVTP